MKELQYQTHNKKIASLLKAQGIKCVAELDAARQVIFCFPEKESREGIEKIYDGKSTVVILEAFRALKEIEDVMWSTIRGQEVKYGNL